MLFQLICLDKVSWDDPLPLDVLHKWHKWSSELRTLNQVTVMRYMFSEVSENIESVEIYGFCDSSLKAYSGLCYLRTQTSIGVKVNLLSAKAKIAPMKKMSIARLELLGCCLLKDLIKSILTAINCVYNVSKLFYWSDSEISLYWIKGVNKEWKAWVENE